MVHARAKYDGNCAIEVAKLQHDFGQARENEHVIAEPVSKDVEPDHPEESAEPDNVANEEGERNVPDAFRSEIQRSRSSSPSSNASSSSSSSSKYSESSDRAQRKSIDAAFPGEVVSDEDGHMFAPSFGEEEAASDAEPSDKVSHDVAFKPRLLVEKEENQEEPRNQERQFSPKPENAGENDEPISELTTITSRSFSPVPAFGGSLKRRKTEISDAEEPETSNVEYARIRQVPEESSPRPFESSFITQKQPYEIDVNRALPAEETSFIQANPILDTSSAEIRKSPETIKPSVKFSTPPKLSSSSNSSSSDSSSSDEERDSPAIENAKGIGPVETDVMETEPKVNISVRHPGPIVTSSNTPLFASEPSSFVEKPVSEMLQQEPSSRRGSRGREIDSQPSYEPIRKESEGTRNFLVSGSPSSRRSSRGREIDPESSVPAARWNVRPGAELPLDAGSSEEASLKNEALEKVAKKRISPELRIAPGSVLRVDPDRVMDVTADSLPIVQPRETEKQSGRAVSSEEERDAPLSPSERKLRNISRSSSRGTLGSQNSIDLDGAEKRSRKSSLDNVNQERRDSDGTRNFLVAGKPPVKEVKPEEAVVQLQPEIERKQIAHRGSSSERPVNNSSGCSRSPDAALQINPRSVPATYDQKTNFAKSGAGRNLPRDANTKTSTHPYETGRKPLTWDDLYPEDKQPASHFLPEEATVPVRQNNPLENDLSRSKTPDSGIKSPRSREMSPNSIEVDDTLKKDSTFEFRENSPLTGGSCDSCGRDFAQCSGGRITPRLEYLESLAQLLISKADEIKATQAELREMEKLLKDHQNRLPSFASPKFFLKKIDNQWGTQTTPSLARRAHLPPFVPLKKTISKLAIEEDVGKAEAVAIDSTDQVVARKKKRSLFSFGRKKDKKNKSLKDKNQTL
ncbi:Oidioi.mRNA.OKI2018_I69.chr2.g8378.t1.cds [Oikopleura dioica]|uniref:Oidioi.mRNA.OKI2018_I69.chr2.g8378.t1.cds n=1 Tax=Oikopleura dioica TaxID=34765 RepID=A0ABN7TEP2_OIKDI|nr:Oidioi.mRNA.OKI2018_I69.chr2.g8378.t1.cds [Oikopleura dioica]